TSPIPRARRWSRRSTGTTPPRRCPRSRRRGRNRRPAGVAGPAPRKRHRVSSPDHFPDHPMDRPPVHQPPDPGTQPPNPGTPPAPRLLLTHQADAGAGWLRWLPGLRMLRHYERGWLRDDVVAGLVLTAMLVPVGIAYAEASGVPGIY